MPGKQRNELTAGLFVVAVVILAVGVLLWLGAADIFRPAGQRAVFSVCESVGGVGLVSGSTVQIAGANVGRIVEVRLEPDKGRALYVADIRRDDVRIYADATARVLQGFVGESSLVVTDRGNPAAGLADQDSPVELTGGLSQAMADISVSAGILREIAGSVRDTVAPEDAEGVLAVIERVVARLDAAADDVTHIAANVRRETELQPETLLTKVHGTMDDVSAITADARPKLRDTLSSVQHTAGRIEQYTDEDVAELLAKLREVNDEVLKIARDVAAVSTAARETTMMNRPKVDEIIDDMTLVSANLKAASTEIRRNPWRLLYRPDNRELHSQNIYDAARAFSDGAHQLDQSLAKLTGLAEAHPDGLPEDDPTLQEIREQIRETFSKFSEAEKKLWEELDN